MFDILIKILMLATVLYMIWAIWITRDKKNLSGSTHGDIRMTLEEKLARLEECGFKLADPFTIHDLLKLHKRKEYDRSGWYLILLELAATDGSDLWRPHCDTLFLMDMECIEDHGDYKSVVDKITRISRGSLHLEDVRDYVDVEEGRTWLSFKYKGEEMRVDFQVKDDWLDTSIFRVFNDLLGKADPSKTLVTCYIDQSVIVGCIDKRYFDRLKELETGFELP